MQNVNTERQPDHSFGRARTASGCASGPWPPHSRRGRSRCFERLASLRMPSPSMWRGAAARVRGKCRPRRATIHRGKGQRGAAGVVTPSLGGGGEDEGTAGREHPGRLHRRGGRQAPVRHRGARCADSQPRAEARAGDHGRHARLRAVFTSAMRAAARATPASFRSPAMPRTSRCTASPPTRRATSPSGTSIGSRRPASARPACGSRSSPTSTRKALVALIKATAKIGLVALGLKDGGADDDPHRDHARRPDGVR
jgi:hypothetical protein